MVMVKALTFVTLSVVAAFSAPAMQQASLATIKLPQAVLADGKPLAAGTYDVVVTSEIVAPAPGETEGAERWVAFVTNGATAGREVATIVADAEIANVAEGPRPGPNTARVDVLKGGEFVRVWINRHGLNYLIHLSIARSSNGGATRS
jgi:hypothetical protein